MEQVTLISVNFNLRDNKAKKETPLYVVIYFYNENGQKKQLKIATNKKVLPLLWDAKKQQPIIYCPSIELTNEQRANQANLLQYITYIKCTLIGGYTYNMDALRQIIYNKVEKNNLEKTTNSFSGLTFNSYIPTVNINSINNIKLNNMNKNLNQFETKSNELATTMIDNAFNSFCQKRQQKESTKIDYIKHLRVWKNWVNETNQPNTIELFKRAKFYAYKQYLQANGKSNDNINRKCQLLAALIREISETEQGIINGITPVNFTETKTVKEKKDALKYNEIEALKNVEISNKNETFCHDVFMLQLATGQRISDIYTLITGDYSTDVEYINLPTKKCSKMAQIEVTDDVKYYLNKVRTYSIPSEKCLEQKINKTIKILAKKANLNRVFEGKILCDNITSHYARHTFITNKLIEGYSAEEVAQMVGNSAKEILKTYSHLTNENIINNLKKKREMLKQERMKDVENQQVMNKKRKKQKLQQAVMYYVMPLLFVMSLTCNIMSF